MNSLSNSAIRKVASLYLRKNGLQMAPRALAAMNPAATAAPVFQPRRYNSSVGDGAKINAVASSTDAVTSSPSIVDQVATAVSNGAAEAVVASEHSNFVISGLMSIIENVHNFVGVPYWEAIVLTTIGFRILLVPISIKTTQASARLAHLRPDLQRLSEGLKNHPEANDDRVKLRFQKEMQAAFLKYKVNPIQAMMWPFAQIPFFLGLFFAVQSMGTYYPGLAEGGAFWFTNLTIPDANYIFPVINAVSFLAFIELGTQDGVQLGKGTTMKNIMRGLAVASIPLTASMPQSVFVFWTTNNVLSLFQTFFLKNSAVKKYFDIPDMPKGEVPELKVMNPVAKFQKFMEDRKDEGNKKTAEILDGTPSKTSATMSPPPKLYNSRPKK